MNQDFRLKLTSGLARRLVKLQTINNINLDPYIIDFAKSDVPDLSAYKLSDSEQKAVQSIMDFDFRCVFPGLNNDKCLLIAAKEKNLKIKIYTSANRKRDWNSLLKEVGITAKIFTKIEEEIYEDRDSLMIIDTWNSYLVGSSECQLLSLDFEKCVITCQKTKSYWMECVLSLFPSAFVDVGSGFMNPKHKKELESMNFTDTDSNKYLFLLNIVTDLVDVKMPISHYEIDPFEGEIF